VSVGPDGLSDNLQIARAIVQFRQGFEARNAIYVNGPAQVNFRSRPFTSIWDLYRVPEIYQLQALLLDPQPAAPANSLRQVLDDRVGDVSPFAYDMEALDFRSRFMGVGERVLLGSSGIRYECIRSHISNGAGATNAPPDPFFWRPAVDPGTQSYGLTRPRFDFKEQSLLLTRVSNLITTRSDMFTVYLLIEGWENAGTSKAERKVSRRMAFFLDRSQTTPGKIELKAPVPIPTD
ncbi:MAG: hypothetical protein NZ561_01890, partial [Phycisphaerae bacterium]|nr:hypothetical protein [Phycisphaerae bacterium]